MIRPSLALILAALILVPTSATEAARSRNRGGSWRRARTSGEALAQRFYEQSVQLGKQRQYGQASHLMKRAVEKNPSNEKYRYFLSLLLYKIGDFGESMDHLKRLENGRMDRYRKKAGALMARIDQVLREEVPVVAPIQPSQPAGSWSHLEVLPPDAYVNVAGQAARFNAGMVKPVQEIHGPTMSPSEYKALREGSAVAMLARPKPERVLPPEPAPPAEAAMTPREPPGIAAQPRAPAPAADAAVAANMDAADAWADAPPTAPAAPAKPAKPAEEDPFAMDAFADAGFDEPETPPAEPEANPFLEEPDPAPEPVEEPDPFEEPEPAPAAAPADDGFDDFGGDGGDAFDDVLDEADSPPPEPEPEPEPEPADEFGEFDEDAFEEF